MTLTEHFQPLIKIQMNYLVTEEKNLVRNFRENNMNDYFKIGIIVVFMYYS